MCLLFHSSILGLDIWERNSSERERVEELLYRGFITVGDENGFQAMKMAFNDFLNKIIVSIWCQET